MLVSVTAGAQSEKEYYLKECDSDYSSARTLLRSDSAVISQYFVHQYRTPPRMVGTWIQHGDTIRMTVERSEKSYVQRWFNEMLVLVPINKLEDWPAELVNIRAEMKEDKILQFIDSLRTAVGGHPNLDISYREESVRFLVGHLCEEGFFVGSSESDWPKYDRHRKVRMRKKRSKK